MTETPQGPAQSLLILANLIRQKAETDPDRDIATFVSVGADNVLHEQIRTYADLWNNGQKLAHALIAAGQQKDERFGMVMHNHPEFAELMVASSIAGNAFVPIDPRAKGRRLAYMVDFAECTGLVIGDYAWDNVREVLADMPRLRWIWVLGEQPGNAPAGIEIRSVADILAASPAHMAIRATSPADVMQLLYTSGTTGDPKAILSTYERLGVAAALPGIFGLTRDDRPYTGLSMTHANAQLITFAASLYGDMRCVISEKFTKSRLWDITRRYGCTVFNLLGGMTNAIYSEPRRDDDADNPVRLVISAGMPKEIWNAFRERFDVELFEMYGAAEGGLTFNPPGAGPAGSIGKPPPMLEMRLVDENDEPVAQGEPGEIIFRNADGSAPKVAYLKNEEATAKKTRGGWLRMGDIGMQDAEGWLYFLFRSGGGIRRNGEFINPAAIEKELAELPAIDDVFVYGIATPANAPGEREVVAAVVLDPAVDFDPAAIRSACEARLEKGSVPQFLHVVDAIPKTASEKPQERFLVEMFDEEAENTINLSKV